MSFRRHLPPLIAIALLAFAIPAHAKALKIATIAPDGTRWMQEMRAGAAIITERTAERVTLKFYRGGVMGSDATVMRKIRAGQLHGGAFTGGSLSELYPDMQVYSLSFLFRDYTEVDAVRAQSAPKRDHRELAAKQRMKRVSHPKNLYVAVAIRCN